MEQAPQQPRKLLIAILVSSLITNVILLSVTGASLVLVYHLNQQVEQLQKRVDDVRQIVDKIKAVRSAVRGKIQERRQGQTKEEPSSSTDTEPPKNDNPPRRPLRRLRERSGR
ncbi:MAG: hypothetical protein GXP25_06235 [Planctomycetes bacterium]|nr:hypothetical protein [Planctomycetota bacterium]